MIKGIFILEDLTQEKLSMAVNLGINAVFTSFKNLDKRLIKKLKSNNFKIYAEISSFVGEELWEKYPKSRPIDENGAKIKRIDWYAGVCPNHPQVRKDKLQLINSIIYNYEIDGLWLDFIRYPCHWEVLNPDLTEYCFCPNCLEKFKNEIGGKPQGIQWVRWKCNQIIKFVADVKNLIKQSGKNIKLGMFSVPWRESDFDGAIEKVIGQDFKSLRKYIDVFSPMVYHKMCGRQTRWIHEIVTYMDKVAGKPILPIIQTEDRPEKISQDEFREEMVYATESPSEGAIIFFWEDLLKNKDKMQIVKKSFTTEEGN